MMPLPTQKSINLKKKTKIIVTLLLSTNTEKKLQYRVKWFAFWWNNSTLVDIITKNCNFGGTTPTLVKRIRQLLSLSWTVKITNTWREGNKSAD